MSWSRLPRNCLPTSRSRFLHSCRQVRSLVLQWWFCYRCFSIQEFHCLLSFCIHCLRHLEVLLSNWRFLSSHSAGLLLSLIFCCCSWSNRCSFPRFRVEWNWALSRNRPIVSLTQKLRCHWHPSFSMHCQWSRVCWLVRRVPLASLSLLPCFHFSNLVWEHLCQLFPLYVGPRAFGTQAAFSVPGGVPRHFCLAWKFLLLSLIPSLISLFFLYPREGSIE